MTVFGTGATAAALFAGEYDFAIICALMVLSGSFLASRYHCIPYADVIGTAALSGVTVFIGMKMGSTIQGMLVSAVAALFLVKVALEPESAGR